MATVWNAEEEPRILSAELYPGMMFFNPAWDSTIMLVVSVVGTFYNEREAVIMQQHPDGTVDIIKQWGVWPQEGTFIMVCHDGTRYIPVSREKITW
jgi:hypothetical protein